jgi:methylmalonyl-CoA mutase N-terminal domain/subunit
MGGMVDAIERGFPQREVAESAYRLQQAIEARQKLIIGVNECVQENESPIDTLYIDEGAADTQLQRLARVRAERDPAVVQASLADMKAVAAGDGNLMPAILAAVRAYATLGEMCDALRQVWGEYEETAVI